MYRLAIGHVDEATVALCGLSVYSSEAIFRSEFLFYFGNGFVYGKEKCFFHDGIKSLNQYNTFV